MSHWLRPLLSPKSIAIVGASDRVGSLAASTYQQLIDTHYRGKIYSVNPKYQLLYEQACYACITDLPEVPDLVVYVISGLALEDSFNNAIDMSVGGIVIYANNYLQHDDTPKLTERLKQKAVAAGIPVCGGNSMGFYNYDDEVFVSFDRPPINRPQGHIGMILHSGSGFTYLANNDPRFCFNYVIASGQEICATVADYIDFLLDQPSTRVIAIMLEAVRDVPSFIESLKKAQAKDIPVLITKLARTEKSAQLALSHSGAIVGNHDAFVAVCERYGVINCRDLDEMIVSAMLFAANFRLDSNRGIASILDSGGMREQMIDLADDYGIRYGDIGKDTHDVIQTNLEPGLEADNPLDAMGAIGRNTEATFINCGKALLDDPDIGLLTIEFEFRDGFSHYPEIFKAIDVLSEYNDKPVLVLNSCAFTSLQETAAKLTHRDIPVINGIDVALRSIRNLTRYRSSVSPTETSQINLNQVNFNQVNFNQVNFNQDKLNQWKSQLEQSTSLDEITSLSLMGDFNLPVVDYQLAQSVSQVRQAADNIGYPLVMKTAEPGIAHKSDCGGVIVGIENQAALEAAYHALQDRLGNRVVIMPMVKAGIEVSLGMKNDPEYGPMVIVASGGILIELLKDRCLALAPVDKEQANQMLDQLKLAKLLAGLRGQPAADRQALVELISRFSQLVFQFADSIAEIDLNPVIVGQQGCTIVDALIVSNPNAVSHV